MEAWVVLDEVWEIIAGLDRATENLQERLAFWRVTGPGQLTPRLRGEYATIGML